ncbi:unnamed protein product [Bemisia tabaci]|uniref:Uncharacterized protein n=1 Tax=Bemisia tabaci TaxID=7038 RepID=A0A9P0AKV4_BEMTA|nr:unnamed protein product [Bemisia tabaci]
MSRRRKDKIPVVPEQDKKICGSICLCQLTIVLSCVSFVYLSVAVYIPSHRAFHAGMEPEPVMCQTVNSTLVNNCNWASCGEWCLTKTSGFCPQLFATVRRNGTDISLEDCSRLSTYSCPQANPGMSRRFNCNNGSECASLTGVFNCSLGHCSNMSELFLCHHKADGIFVDSEKDNLKLNGFFECHHSRCRQIKKPFSCDRYCMKITTTAVNIYLSYGDQLYTGDCRRALAYNAANGTEPGYRVNATEIWTEESSGGLLLASCHSVVRDNNTLKGYDCLNGTILQEQAVPQPFINFTTFWALSDNSTKLVDRTQRFLPMQRELTIFNSSKLFINLDGCVNTLRGECLEFYSTHGRDGDNQTAQSRYTCFYNKKDSSLVVARFDLNKTWWDLVIAVCVPGSLFVVSFISLAIITHTVRVDDDARMRCKWCEPDDGADDEPGLVMDGLINQTNNIAAMDKRVNDLTPR